MNGEREQRKQEGKPNEGKPRGIRDDRGETRGIRE